MRFKNILLTLLLIFSAQNVIADSTESRPYIGLSYSFHHVALRNDNSNLETTRRCQGLEGTVGYKLDDRWSVETSAYQLRKGRGGYHVSISALSFHPVTSDIQLFLGIGLSGRKISYTYSYITPHQHPCKSGSSDCNCKCKGFCILPRIMIGSEIFLRESLYLRIYSSLEGVVKSKSEVFNRYNTIFSYGAGFTYKF